LIFFVLQPAAHGGQRNPISGYIDLAAVPPCAACANEVQTNTYSTVQKAHFELHLKAEQRLQLLISNRAGMHLNDTRRVLS
jgi:hypothetical protein